MNEFLFSTVSDVIMGPDTSESLGNVASSLGISRALVVTDDGIIRHGLLDKALQSLQKLKIQYHVYSDVVADPPEEIVLDAVAIAQSFKCDGVIGFGGGSSMDVAKLL